MNRNQLPKMPAYWVVNLHSSYKITDNIEVFGLVRNLFDQHYYVYGTLFDIDFVSVSEPDRPAHLRSRHSVRRLCRRARHAAYQRQPVAAIAAKSYAPIPAKAPPPPAAPFNWTGIYLGVNGGYSFGSSDWTDALSAAPRAAISALQALRSVERSAPITRSDAFVVRRRGRRRLDRRERFRHFHARRLLRRRLPDPQQLACHGARPRRLCVRPVLVYGTGGAAFGDVRANFSNDPVSSATEAGWTVGAGVEVALAKNWTAKAEYLFVDLDDGSCTADCAIADPSDPPTFPTSRSNSTKAWSAPGVNYKFTF